VVAGHSLRTGSPCCHPSRTHAPWAVVLQPTPHPPAARAGPEDAKSNRQVAKQAKRRVIAISSMCGNSARRNKRRGVDIVPSARRLHRPRQPLFFGFGQGNDFGMAENLAEKVLDQHVRMSLFGKLRGLRNGIARSFHDDPECAGATSRIDVVRHESTPRLAPCRGASSHGSPQHRNAGRRHAMSQRPPVSPCPHLVFEVSRQRPFEWFGIARQLVVLFHCHIRVHQAVARRSVERKRIGFPPGGWRGGPFPSSAHSASRMSSI